jgi:hypothetical protein
MILQFPLAMCHAGHMFCTFLCIGELIFPRGAGNLIRIIFTKHELETALI